MISCIYVGVGGFIGAVLRYLAGMLPFPNENLPVSTLLINTIGALVMGIIVGISVKTNLSGTNLMLFLKVGLCGGFTTFSAFSLETHNLIVSGKPVWGILYAILSVTLCIFAIFIGQNNTKL